MPPARTVSSLSARSSASQSTRCYVGRLTHRGEHDTVISCRDVFSDHDLLIGRDKSRCQYVIGGPTISNKHIRVYTIVYDTDALDDVPPLTYAEDLSRNGTYWNGVLIGKGNGGFLLSDGDVLRLSSKTTLTFHRSLFKSNVDIVDRLQLGEMELFNREYVVTDRLLGSGAHGKVFMAIEKTTNTQIACKMVDLRPLQTRTTAFIGRLEQPAAAKDVDSRLQLRKITEYVQGQRNDNKLEEQLAKYYREIEILSSLRHPNIVGIEKAFVTDNTIYLFQELVTAGDLFSYIERRNGRLLEVEAAVIIRQIVTALEYLHSRGIVHRDVKPDNILMASLAAGTRVVLSDFGAARRIDENRPRMASLVGTEDYAAPELTNLMGPLKSKKGYTKAVDMWALGCVSVILLTGASPWSHAAQADSHGAPAKVCTMEAFEILTSWRNLSSKPKEFVKKLLVLDENSRMTAQDALKDAWFASDVYNADFDELYRKTIRHWKSHAVQNPALEFVDARRIQSLQCSVKIIQPNSKFSHPRPKKPVEPPYKPFARNMYSPLFPPRPAESRLMSKEVQEAIKNSWSLKATCDTGAVQSEDNPLALPTPTTSSQGRHPLRGIRGQSDSLLGNLQGNSEVASDLLRPRKSITASQRRHSLDDSAGETQNLRLGRSTNRGNSKQVSHDPSAWSDGDLDLYFDRRCSTKTTARPRARSILQSCGDVDPLGYAPSAFRRSNATRSDTESPEISASRRSSSLGLELLGQASKWSNATNSESGQASPDISTGSQVLTSPVKARLPLKHKASPDNLFDPPDQAQSSFLRVPTLKGTSASIVSALRPSPNASRKRRGGSIFDLYDKEEEKGDFDSLHIAGGISGRLTKRKRLEVEKTKTQGPGAGRIGGFNELYLPRL